MFCVFLIFATLYLSFPGPSDCQLTVDPLPFRRLIRDYFKSGIVRQFKKEWDDTYRRAIGHALVIAMKETVGVPGMNVYIRKRKEKLAAGFLHNDNQVRVILKDLTLEDIPRILLPDVQFSLASNVLKLYTGLSKMVIHADYALIRNKSDIIHDTRLQNPYKNSPFLFEQVQDVGKVAISIENCKIKAFMTAMCSGDTVNLGYSHAAFSSCVHIIEIYTPGEDTPPVIARYNLTANNAFVGLKRLLMKPLIIDELVPKLQAAIFSFVNTSAMFGRRLREYRDDQQIVYQITANQVRELVRYMNKLSVRKCGIEMPDYEEYWDDGRISTNMKKRRPGEKLRLTQMVLTGLGTLYSAHSGGPYKMYLGPKDSNNIKICEKLRYSSLQVRGKLEIISTWSDTFDFSSEISDLTMDLQLDLLESNLTEEESSARDDMKRRFRAEVMRRMTLTVPNLIFSSAESLISGYLLREVSKLVHSHTTKMFDKALHILENKGSYKKISALDPEGNDGIDGMVGTSDEQFHEIDSKDSDLAPNNLKGTGMWDTDDSIEVDDPIKVEEPIKGARGRDIFKKTKKRFKSPNRARHLRLSGKRVQDNQLRKK